MEALNFVFEIAPSLEMMGNTYILMTGEGMRNLGFPESNLQVSQESEPLDDLLQ